MGSEQEMKIVNYLRLSQWAPPRADNVKSQIVGMHYLRAIATIFVVVSHSFQNTATANPKWDGPLTKFFFSGGGEIDFFFIMSSFIMYHTAIDPTTNSPKITGFEFLKRRFIRIIPLLWIAVLFYDFSHFLAFRNIDLEGSLRTLFLWPVGDSVPTVAWTIKFEALFYLLFGLSVLESRKFLPLMILWFAAPAVRALITWSLTDDTNTLIGFLSNSVNLDFGIGFLLAITSKKWASEHRARFPLAMLLLLSLALRAYVKFFDLKLGTLSMVVLIGPLTAATLMYAVKCRPINVSNIARILGDASYSIFLFHPPIVALAIFVLNKTAHDLPGPIAATICTVIAVAFGCLIHFSVEKRLTSAVSSFVNRIAPRRQFA